MTHKDIYDKGQDQFAPPITGLYEDFSTSRANPQ